MPGWVVACIPHKLCDDSALLMTNFVVTFFKGVIGFRNTIPVTASFPALPGQEEETLKGHGCCYSLIASKTILD